MSDSLTDFYNEKEIDDKREIFYSETVRSKKDDIFKENYLLGGRETKDFLDVIKEVEKEQKEKITDKLPLIQQAATKLKQLQRQQEEFEQQLEFTKKEIERFSRSIIPGLLEECGLASVVLNTGEKVEVKECLKASISKENTIQAYNFFMGFLGEGDPVKGKALVDDQYKTTIEIPLGNNSADEGVIRQNLAKLGVFFDVKRDLHYQTLQKLCRMVKEKGEEIPPEISVFEYKETKLK